MPAGLLMLAFCAVIFKSTMEMFDFVKFYEYYALPFQLLIPLIIWITAEIRTKRGRLFLKFNSES
jgi:spore germination protein KB